MWRVIKRLALGAALVCCVLFAMLAVQVRRAHAAAAVYRAAHDMGGHMSMTKLRPMAAGDQARADAIVVAARKYAERYTDYKKALADGFKIFLPDAPQKMYHFTLGSNALAAEFGWDPDRPTSLLYEKHGADYKLVGVMYTDRIAATEKELDSRVPLSVAQWHVHTNLCLPPKGEVVDWKAKDAKFGLAGSIQTAEACKAAGGRFMPHLFGWMVHVYPFETEPAKIWGAGMGDDEVDHAGMAGMKM